MTAPEFDGYAEVEDEEEADEMADEAYNAAPETADFLKAPPAPVETKVEPAALPSHPPVHKRTYVEESTIQIPSLSAAADKETTQTKKARFEESVSSSVAQASPLQQASAGPQPTQSAAPIVQKQAQVTSQASAPPPAPASEDDSDDELPTLNMDPDTDDEDDEDVTMEG
jgi:pre-rRNA-processing protein RIX1